MKILGFLLLAAGWVIVLSALILLKASAPQGAFALAGVGVQIMGLILAIRAHPLRQGEHR